TWNQLSQFCIDPIGYRAMSNHDRSAADEAFKQGVQAMRNKNWEYSCRMFRRSVDLVPEKLLFRQCLRGATEKTYNDNKTGASMPGMRLMSTKAMIRKSRISSDWSAVINLCEDGLAINPWDHALMADLADALQMMGFMDAAAWSIYEALK